MYFLFYKKNQKEKPQGIHMLKQSKGPKSTYQPTRESWVDTDRRGKIQTNLREYKNHKCIRVKNI